MTQCTACAAELPSEARFCLACGTPVAPPVCSGCGEALPPTARFCMSCGTPRATGTSAGAGRAEGSDVGSVAGARLGVASRRVTSILFGDLVGFTTLSEARDQDDVRELLSRYFDECRQVIARYGGTVEKFIGDAVMAVWGVPTSHEDDPERAVRAGLELVAAVAQFGREVGAPDLALRVGIVTGEVAVTVGATHEGMVAGDAVNTAARVQAAANPGSVWVDETTKLLTAAAITYADAGSHQLKGKADPVPLWSVRAVVAAVGGAQRADGLESPLVGRDRELRLVKELFHHSEESGLPTLLVVQGEPGVGKTRLRWEFEKYVDGVTSTVRWHSGRCISYGEGVAYFAVAEAVRGRLQTLAAPSAAAGPDDPETLDVLLDRGLEHYVEDPEERSWMRDRLAALLGVGTAVRHSREDLYSAWVAFFERVGGGHPVTIVIDDAQYADEGLLGFVEHLLTTGTFSCFVMLLARPGLLEARPQLVTNRRANVIHLPTLSEVDMDRMVEGLVSGLPDHLRAGLVARSDGVPLFAVEMVRSLIDRDVVVPRGGQYVLAESTPKVDLDAISAPASLQALIAARLDTLTAEQRRLVDRASVLGDSFGLAAIAGVCPDLPDVAQVLRDLVRLQILAMETSRMSAEFGSYRFVQSAVRQVAYGSLSRRDRKAIHLAAVEQFDQLGEDGDDTAVMRAQHYLEALSAVPHDPDVPALRSAALENLRRAAARARALGSPGEAARHLESAMRLVDDDLLRATLCCDLARAEHDAAEYESAMSHALESQELFEGLGDRLGAGLAVATYGSCLANGLGRNEEASALVERWWTELRDRTDAEETLSELSRVVLWTRWRLKADTVEILEWRMPMAERSGRTADLIECYNGLAIHYSELGAMSLPRVLLDAAADLARGEHDLYTLCLTLVNIASRESAFDLERSLAVGKEATDVGTRLGLPYLRVYAQANYAISAWMAGEWGAIDDLLQDRSEGSAGGLDETVLAIGALHAHACGLPWESARTGPDKESDDQMWNGWHAFLHATEALNRGDLDTATAEAMRAVELIHDASGLSDDLPHMWLVAADLALGRHTGAISDDAAVQQLLSYVESKSAIVPLALQGHVAHVRGVLAIRGGRQDEVEALLGQALDAYAEWGSVPCTAKVKADLGRWLVTQGQETRGAALVAEARATYERLGARRWLDGLGAAGHEDRAQRDDRAQRGPQVLPR